MTYSRRPTARTGTGASSPSCSDKGGKVSKKTVLTLMRELGLACPVRRRKRYNSLRGSMPADNVLNRQFATEFRHTTWVTDVTEFNIGNSKVYHSPILDLHNNRIISVTAGPSPSVKMVTDSLRMATNTLNAGEKPLVHSNQGFQYRHTLWRDTLREAGLTQSMSSKGTCLDNAVMEGFFSHLKEEWFARPETRNSRRVSHGAHRLPAMVEHHPHSTATRLPQPRRVPRPNIIHCIRFD